MKTTQQALPSLLFLCSALAVMSVSGQTTYTWTNNAVVADLATAANWDPNGVPFIGSATVAGDTMLFDGRTTGPVSATSNTGAQTGSSVGNPLAGIHVHLTANQTNPVTFHTTVANSVSPGIRFNSIVIDAGAGSFTLGKNSTTNCLDTLWGASNPSNQGLTNNSANPAYILPDMRWRMGAGGAHTITFGGSGDWYVTNDVANVGGAATLVDKEGSGTMYWIAGHNIYWSAPTVIASPMTIGAGTLVLRSGGLFPPMTTINNNGTLVYDAPASSQAGGAQTNSNPINGSGSLRVNDGTLTLAGANTITGNINLSGGKLSVARVETGANGPLGVGGTISFTGGTLGFSAINTFDYSSRFSTAAGQQYRIDTAGQSVVFASGLSSSGGSLTKLGAGTLALSGTSAYDGLTSINAGKVVFQGAKTGGGDIAVNDGAALGVTAGSAPVTPTSLTLGTSAGCTLEFNNVTNTATALIAASTISSAGTNIINVNGPTLTIGHSYPLLTWTSGPAPAVALGTLSGYAGSLSFTGNTLFVNVSGYLATWTGAADGINFTNAGNWASGHVPSSCSGETAEWNGLTTSNLVIACDYFDPNNCSSPWGLNLVLTPNQTNSVQIIAPHPAAAGLEISTINNNSPNAALILGESNTANSLPLVPKGWPWVNHSTSACVINQGAQLGGTALRLGGTGDWDIFNQLYSGMVGVGRTLTIDGPGSANWTATGPYGVSPIAAICLNGGKLVLKSSGTLTDQPITNHATLVFDAPGQSQTLAGVISGAGQLQVNSGRLTLEGANTFSGGTTINGGILQVGTGGSNGLPGSGPITNHGALVFTRAGQWTVANTISGTGSVTNIGGSLLMLTADNTYSGGTTINAGALSIDGTLNSNGNVVVNNGSIMFASGRTNTLNGVISGNGALYTFGTGKVTLNANNTYTGDTSVSGGTLTLNGSNATATIYLYSGALLINSSCSAPIFAWGGNLGGTGVLRAPVTLNAGGGLAPGAIGSVGTLTVSNNLTFGGRLVFDVNKSLSPASDFLVVSGALTNTGNGSLGSGTLAVANLGPALAVGDKFTLFSKPMQHGDAVTVSGAGATWANNLAVDGSITVASVTRPTMNFTQPTASSLQFSWDTSFGNYKLQTQTNSLTTGLSTNWTDYPGGTNSPATVLLGVTNGAVFFRLISRP